MHKVAWVPDVRIQYLRHIFASLLVSGGALLEMIGRLPRAPKSAPPSAMPT